MKRNLLFCLVALFASCGGDAGKFSDPPPAPKLSVEEAQRQSLERSRLEREQEGVRRPPEDEEDLPKSGPAPMVRDESPRTTTRPLTADELKRIHDALKDCGQTAASVAVLAEPGGVVFLAPGQRFPEADLACYAQKLGTVRLAADVARKGTITLP